MINRSADVGELIGQCVDSGGMGNLDAVNQPISNATASVPHPTQLPAARSARRLASAPTGIPPPVDVHAE
ncbi:hypothetical protein FDZ84_09635 [Saccharopolyspora sp. ASAGF58]|nr:hypothetical protein FDZ84_09635 [Saccharopolyspora sp. ASAGF58]